MKWQNPETVFHTFIADVHWGEPQTGSEDSHSESETLPLGKPEQASAVPGNVLPPRPTIPKPEEEDYHWGQATNQQCYGAPQEDYELPQNDGSKPDHGTSLYSHFSGAQYGIVILVTCGSRRHCGSTT